MTDVEKVELVRAICYCRDCDDCAIYKLCDRNCYSVSEMQVISVCRKLYETHDKMLFKGMERWKNEKRYRYNAVIKYCGGVQYG